MLLPQSMIRQLKLVVTATDRRGIREQVVGAFLSEEAGTGKGELCSVYLYEVEQLLCGNTVFLKRPGRLNKGFDFEINVSATNFGKNRRTTMPSHANIFDDLKQKQSENPAEFKKVLGIIRRLYNCEIVPCEEMHALTFKAGFPPEMILKAIKWLFIEQDVRRTRPMPHQYKRRTFDEAQALALAAYRSLVSEHLTDGEIQEMREHGTLGGGSVGEGWELLVGHVPEERMYYEFQLYRPSSKCPYIGKYFARILVTRDRASEAVHILWRPPVPEYHGPHFE